jgi:hypothetical protein
MRTITAVSLASLFFSSSSFASPAHDLKAAFVIAGDAPNSLLGRRRVSYDAAESSRFAGVGTLDTGEPCDHVTTVSDGVTVTVPVTTVAAASPQQTGVGNVKHGGGHEHGGEGGEQDDEGGEEDANGGQGNGALTRVTVHDTVTSTLTINQFNDGSSDNDAIQLSFVTETVFASGEAPTVTLTPLERTITQLLTVTEVADGLVSIAANGDAPAGATVTLVQAAVTETQVTTVLSTETTTATTTEAGDCGTDVRIFIFVPSFASIGLSNTLQSALPPAATDLSQSETAAANVPPPAASSIEPVAAVASGTANGVGTYDAYGQCGCSCMCAEGAFPEISAAAQPSASVSTSTSAELPATTLQTVFSVEAASVEVSSSIEEASSVDTSLEASSTEVATSTIETSGAETTAVVTSSTTLEVEGAAIVVPTLQTGIASLAANAFGSPVTDVAVGAATQTAAATNAIQTGFGLIPAANFGQETSIAGLPADADVGTSILLAPPTASPGVFLESQSTTESLVSVTASPEPTAAVAAGVAQSTGGAAEEEIDIGAYTLASAIALGNLGRR